MVQKNSGEYTVSVIWGKSNNYVPLCNEAFVWDASLKISGAALLYLDHLHYKFVMWAQAHEEAERIFDAEWHSLLSTKALPYAWKSSIKPGEAGGLEGIRFAVKGKPDALVTIDMQPIKIQFRLSELIEKEHIRYHVGAKYSGVPVEIFLGKDARKRVSKKDFRKELDARSGAGVLLVPDDFSPSETRNVHSMYGCVIRPESSIESVFNIENYEKAEDGGCLVKIQLMALFDSKDYARWMDLEVEIAGISRHIHYSFSTRATIKKLEDIYVEIPWSSLKAENNTIIIRNMDAETAFLLHRVYVGCTAVSYKDNLQKLPPLPEKRLLRVGYDTNMTNPLNGDIDNVIDIMKKDETGNHLLFRERGSRGTQEEMRQWAEKLLEYGFTAASCSAPAANEGILAAVLKDSYIGVHTHEISNLIYGWGAPDPLSVRAARTLPECREYYMKRMSPCRMTGQAMPWQALDYASGVKTVITELPCSHASLCLAGARGAAKAFKKDFWGVHIANHVPRSPVDEDTERRHFIIMYQSFLYGAKLLYDEEVAIRYNHDTAYAFSDPVPDMRRRQYQDFYHYGSRMISELGMPDVKIGFLQGNFDCLVGGLQALPYIEPTKVWGMIGPETKAWEYDTPERGWELLSTFMPGVWLYPVKQDPRKVRQFFTGTPHGQVDLLPIDASQDTLNSYEVLCLPGWNTMTEDIHKGLVEYAQKGGHLIICAAQCTVHITRDFLLEKRDFNFFRAGDLSELAGVKLGAPEGIVNAACFEDEMIPVLPGVPALETELCGAAIIAADQFGRPLLVEKKLGKGRVWMLTAGEYWGHEALDEFRVKLGQMIVAEHRGDVYMSGDTEDIDFHRFKTDSFERVILLNTDWSSSGNIKSIMLHTPYLEIPLKVREGRLTQILLASDIAIVFETGPALIESFRQDGDILKFRAGGVGKVSFGIFAGHRIDKSKISGDDIEFRGNSLEIDFGSSWTCKDVEII